MTEVTHMKPAASEPDQEVVKVLTRALEMAISGDLRSVIIVGTLSGGDAFTDFTTKDIFTDVGHLEMLKFRLLSGVQSFPITK